MKIIKNILVFSVIIALSVGIPSMGWAEEKVVITMFAGAVGMESQLIHEGVQLYMKEHPNVEIKIKPAPESTTVRLMMYRKQLVDEDDRKEVDIYQIDVIWPGEIGHHFLGLNDYGAAEYAKEHFLALIQNNTVNGQLIAMPWFTDAGLLFYRTDLLEKYGYSGPPKTWDELEEMAKIIQDGEIRAGRENFWGFVWQGSIYEGLTCDALEWVASHGGGTFIDAEKNVTINNPKAIKALRRAANWIGFISPIAVTGFMEEDARRWWQAGNAAFMRNWPYAVAMGNSEESPIKGKFDVAPLPGDEPGQSAATLGGWQLAVSKYTEHPKEAAEFVFFMTSKAEQKRRAIAGSYSPTISSLYKDPDVIKAMPFFEKLYDVFVNAVARPSGQTAPKYSQASDLIFNGVHDVLTGKRDAQAVLEALQVDLEDLVTSE